MAFVMVGGRSCLFSRALPDPYQIPTKPYQTSTAPPGPYQTARPALLFQDPTRRLPDPYETSTAPPGLYQTPINAPLLLQDSTRLVPDFCPRRAFTHRPGLRTTPWTRAP